jgi:NAD(P)-dependent dehydrogenase (short-subunit alcohol dehydrogenase family)
MARIAVITGGAQGIGAAVAQRFKADGFAGVVLVDRNAEGLSSTAQRLGVGFAKTLAADLRDEATAAKAIDLAVTSFGRIDALVNVAASTERCGIDDTTPEAFSRIFDINVKAPLFLMQAAAKVMKTNGGGVVVNIGSVLSHGGPPNIGTYSASKAALVVLTKNAANAWKRQGIRAFVVNPGWVNTDGEHKLQTEFHRMPQNWAEIIGKRMPFGKMIGAADIAAAVSFLCSPDAGMMTGAVIDYEQMPMGTYDEYQPLGPE